MGKGQQYSDSSSNQTWLQIPGSPASVGEPSSLSEAALPAEGTFSQKQNAARGTQDLHFTDERHPPSSNGARFNTYSKTETGLPPMLRVGGTARESSARIIAWASQLEALFEAMSDGVMVYDQEARLIYANTAARQIFADTHWIDYQSLPLAERARLLDIRDETGTPLTQERWLLSRLLQEERIPGTQAETVQLPINDGSMLWLSMRGAPLYNAGDQIVGALLISQDITPLKKAEQLKQDIQTMKEVEQLKDDFIAMAAHELRSPLTALMGYAEILNQQAESSRGSELAEWQIEALETIAHDTMRIVGLTNDLLDVTRLQAGQLPLHRYNTNLVALAQRVVTRMRNTTKQHTLIVETTAQIIAVNIDIQRIEQVVTNLLNNAIKYSPNSTGVLLSIQEDTPAGIAILSVRDQGIGIPVNQQAQIFSRFYRAPNATRLGLEGSGLGLYLCRELVQLHGGHIWFASAEGQGSTFFISLPLATGSPL